MPAKEKQVSKKENQLPAGKKGDIKFRSVLLLSGKTATGFKVPEEIVKSLGESRKPPVSVTINGYTYRSSIAFMGGVFMLPVSADVRANTGLAAGDEAEVKLEPDNKPREVMMPADFNKALNNNKNAKEFFEGLSYSNKLRHVLSIDGAKTPETRLRRIEKAISMLEEGRK